MACSQYHLPSRGSGANAQRLRPTWDKRDEGCGSFPGRGPRRQAPPSPGDSNQGGEGGVALMRHKDNKGHVEAPCPKHTHERRGQREHTAPVRILGEQRRWRRRGGRGLRLWSRGQWPGPRDPGWGQAGAAPAPPLLGQGWGVTGGGGETLSGVRHLPQALAGGHPCLMSLTGPPTLPHSAVQSPGGLQTEWPCLGKRMIEPHTDHCAETQAQGPLPKRKRHLF